MNDVVKVCIKCGEAERNSNGQCKPCARVYAKARRAENPEKAKEIAATYRANHLKKEKARGAKYRAANKAHANAKSNEWNRKNPIRLKEKHDIWRLANAGKIKASSAARYLANRERLKAVSAEWRRLNPALHKAAFIAWAKENPEAIRINRQNRRARTLSLGGKLSRGLTARLFKLQKGKCPCCGNPLGENYHLDHVMPLALGGSHTDGNMQLLRKRCNLQKHARHPNEFMQSRGFLL